MVVDHTQVTCPNCGYCPTCGRGYAPRNPWNPWPTYPSPGYPLWITTTGDASPPTDNFTIWN